MACALLATSLLSVPHGSAISLRAVCRNSYQNVCILRDMKTHMPVLEIRILECRGERVHPDWGCQPSLALNLQLVLAPAALPATLAAFWDPLAGRLRISKLSYEMLQVLGAPRLGCSVQAVLAVACAASLFFFGRPRVQCPSAGD